MATQQAVVDVLLPRRFLFYLVAKVGKGGRHRPLAVALIDASCNYSGQDSEGYNVFKIILRLMSIFSHPANSQAIQGEIQLARRLYGDGHHDPPRSTLPDFDAGPQGQDPFGLFDAEEEEVEDAKPGASDIPQFPFFSSCLLLGPGPLTLRPLSQSVSLQPLGTEFRDDNLEPIGMVVLDISDPSRDGLRYGIISFGVRQMADVHVRDDDQGWDPVEDDPPINDPVPTLDTIRPRAPQSASECVLNRGIEIHEHAIRELDQRPVVDDAALEFIWPSPDVDSTHGSESSQQEGSGQGMKSLRDQSLLSLIDGTQNVNSYDMAAFEQPLQLPDFQPTLLRLLEESPERLGPTRAAGQLLSLAYSGREHLDWTMYKSLSSAGIAAALESNELAQTKSLTVCIDLSRDQATKVVEALSRSSSLREIALLQDPAGVDDQGIGGIYEAISASADARVRRLMAPEVQLTVAGAHSSALRKQPWLRPAKPGKYRPNLDAFPVQQLLLRREPPRNRKPGEAIDWKKDHFFLGDALLRPQRFAAGLVQFLASAERDELVSCFSSSPRTLSDMSGCEISPVPAEYYATVGDGATRQQQRTGDRPNRLEEIAAGSWTALVSQGWHVDYETERYHRGARIYNRAKYTRYALVRARSFISVEDEQISASSSSSSKASRVIWRPEDLEVHDLKGFLEATTPEYGAEGDGELVDRRLSSSSRSIAVVGGGGDHRRAPVGASSFERISGSSVATAIAAGVASLFLACCRLDGLDFGDLRRLKRARKIFKIMTGATAEQQSTKYVRPSLVFETKGRGSPLIDPLKFRHLIVPENNIRIVTSLSLLCKASDLFTEISLYDIVHAPGIATDLNHIDTKAKVSGYLPAENGLTKALTGADVIVVTAGIARKPGMMRDDLFKTNASIIHDIFTEVAKTCPGALCCVVTNPVNSTVPVAAETLRKAGVFDPARLFGVTTLDVEIKVPVIGGHSGATILPLYSQAQPSIQLEKEVLAQVINRVQFGGDEIVKSKQGAGSATTCMAYAGFRFVKALLTARSGKEVTEEAYIYLPGVPGGKEIAAGLGVDYFAVKVQLTQNGASRALPIGELSENEKTLLTTAISELKVNIATGLDHLAVKAQS